MVELRSPKPSMGVRIPLPLPKNLSQFMAEIFYVKFAKFDYHAQSNAKCYHSPILHWRYHVTQWHKQQIWMIIFKLVHNWTQFKNMIVASQHDNLPYGKYYGYKVSNISFFRKRISLGAISLRTKWVISFNLFVI